MISIGVSQIKNSTNIAENFLAIKKSLELFESSDVDLILFPECALSGFSAVIKDCTLDSISNYLDEINLWSQRTRKYVILPTALKIEKIYNTGYIFGGDKIERFYKVGLTDSEKNFFSIPEVEHKKTFRINDHNFGILICFEAQLSPWKYFEKNEVDVILWPGYWGWNLDDKWDALNRDSEPNLIFKNMGEWKVPLIQSNFAFNDLLDSRNTGPRGLSMFVDGDNTLIGQGDCDRQACYRILIEDKSIRELGKLGEF